MENDLRDKLIEDHIKLAEFMTRKYSKLFYSLDRIDIRSASYYALFKASRRYKPEKGIKFTTYAFRCIKHEIMQLADKNNANLLSIDNGLIELIPTDDIIIKTEEKLFIDFLLSCVSESERDILIKYYIEGFFYHEIAAENDWCYQNVQRICRQAEKRIREEIKKADL